MSHLPNIETICSTISDLREICRSVGAIVIESTSGGGGYVAVMCHAPKHHTRPLMSHTLPRLLHATSERAALIEVVTLARDADLLTASEEQVLHRAVTGSGEDR